MVAIARKTRDPLVGTVVAGRFSVKRPLATGGMAKVYVARDETTGDRVALKVALKRSSRDTMLWERECAALDKVEHEHVVKKIDAGQLEDGRTFLAMPLVEGVSVTAWCKHENPSRNEIQAVLLQVLGGLKALHRQSIVHRDVKASNILVDDKGQVMLIDLGIVSMTGFDIEDDEQLLGGLHTSSPEQIRREPVVPASDIYSFGVVAYRLLAKRYPFHSKLPAEVLSYHLHREPAPLPDDVPVALAEAVVGCLAKNALERPTVAELESILSGQPAERSWMPTAAIVAVLGLAAFAAYWAFAR